MVETMMMMMKMLMFLIKKHFGSDLVSALKTLLLFTSLIQYR